MTVFARRNRDHAHSSRFRREHARSRILEHQAGPGIDAQSVRGAEKNSGVGLAVRFELCRMHRNESRSQTEMVEATVDEMKRRRARECNGSSRTREIESPYRSGKKSTLGLDQITHPLE